MSLRAVALTVSLVWLSTPAALAGKTERVSVDSHGNPTPSGLSDFGSISASGRFAAFDSDAATLVPHDTNGEFDVFVHDRSTGKTTRVSVATSGAQSLGGESFAPSISGNGRFVAFFSRATNLVENDTNGANDVFVHDRATGRTKRVSVATDGTEGDGTSDNPAISASGRYVVFRSRAENLVENDTNNCADVFVHDRKKGKARRVSIDSSGVEGDDDSLEPGISAKGRTVVFESNATNLVLGDTNGKLDFFVHDRKTGVVARESLDSSGSQATDSESRVPTLSRTGRFVLFESHSAQLVSLDTNNSTDIFVRDRKTGRTSRASLAANGAQSANPNAYYPAISGSGKFAIFTSSATDFDGSDANGTGDIFVCDLR